MPTEKLPDETLDTAQDAISEDHDFWSRQFLKHFEIHLLDSVSLLRGKSPIEDYQEATVRAVIETLHDSGMEIGAFVELVAKSLASVELAEPKWLPQMNDRRMELIDKQIQETITVAELIELAQLTQAMRDYVDSESSLPMEGAKALHRKLLSIRRGDAND
ncbi:hypothetical protein SH528x_006534 [Novipirellula sp. SH528]|uniref:hypothetical protein n=1 Tax=Novipirellula sp. SH528 TaxID=3454466 RepID=UPI003F9F0452